MNNGTKIIHYENDMAWTDNFGNYGSAFCYGSFISKNDVEDWGTNSKETVAQKLTDKISEYFSDNQEKGGV